MSNVSNNPFSSPIREAPKNDESRRAPPTGNENFREKIDRRQPGKEDQEKMGAKAKEADKESPFSLLKKTSSKQPDRLPHQPELPKSKSETATPKQKSSSMTKSEAKPEKGQTESPPLLKTPDEKISHDEFPQQEFPQEAVGGEENMPSQFDQMPEGMEGEQAQTGAAQKEGQMGAAQKEGQMGAVQKEAQAGAAQKGQIQQQVVQGQQLQQSQQFEQIKGGMKKEGTSESGGVGSKKPTTGKGEGGKAGAPEFKAEMGGVNAPVQGVNLKSDKAAEAETAPPATIGDIANRIVDKIQVMRAGNETQTTITLRQPPMLEGATITLTASDNAKKEFNIQFANLSNEAQKFLDTRLKGEGGLREALEKKDIVVHVMTTSTQPAETLISADAGQAGRERQDQQGQQQGQGQGEGKGEGEGKQDQQQRERQKFKL